MQGSRGCRDPAPAGNGRGQRRPDPRDRTLGRDVPHAPQGEVSDITLQAADGYRPSAAAASATAASSAPVAKGEVNPAEATRPWNGIAPPRPHKAT